MKYHDFQKSREQQRHHDPYDAYGSADPVTRPLLDPLRPLLDPIKPLFPSAGHSASRGAPYSDPYSAPRQQRDPYATQPHTSAADENPADRIDFMLLEELVKAGKNFRILEFKYP